MQSIAAIRSLRRLPSGRTCLVPFARAATTTPFKTADPAVHSEVPPGEDAEEQKKAHHKPTTNDPTEPVKTPPFASSPMLGSAEVGPKAGPIFQQKRHVSCAAASLDGVACVGVDGSPLNCKDGNWQNVEDQEEGVDENRKYYEEHKPSPLSEIKFVDTRKPITRATDGEKDDDVWGGEGTGYLIKDTVDEALQRAEAMFNAAKERGDPSMPPSRALMRKILELQQSQMSEYSEWT